MPTQTRRAPAADVDLLGLIEGLQDLEGRPPFAYHRIPGGEEALGVGRAVEFARASDGGRLAPAYRRARRALGEHAQGLRSSGLHLFAAVAFDRGRVGRAGDPWEPFPRLSLYLPRHLFVRDGDHVRVVTAGAEVGQTGLTVEALLEMARRPAERVPSRGEVDTEPLEEDAYRAGIERARREAGVRKTVIARRLKVTTSAPISAVGVARRLAELYPSCRLFAMAPGAVGARAPVFVGASPERLVEVRGDRARTMALAGSLPRSRAGMTPADRLRLQSSEKDLAEHEYVRRMILETFEALGARARCSAAPRVVELPNVLHLRTPIEAELPPRVGAASVIDALHPTPAVCGTPTAAAAELIRQVEPFDRGLYAGVVGWMDLDGGGDFSVALRCGVLEGRRAHLFAGGGITADSDPEAEAAETDAKFAPMLQALRGADGA